MKALMGMIVSVTAALALGGCGDDETKVAAGDRDGDGSEYCALVEAWVDGGPSAHMAGAESDEEAIEAFEAILSDIRALGQEAPEEIRSVWTGLDKSMGKALKAFQEDLVDAENPPAGMTKDDAIDANLGLVSGVFEALVPDPKDLAEAQGHAKSECGVELD